jgi:hypothetical protein
MAEAAGVTPQALGTRDGGVIAVLADDSKARPAP